jgi:methionyl-tRNA synthetase
MSDHSGQPSSGETFRRSVEALHDRCPKCGGELDTGWECNDCGHDARPDMPIEAPSGDHGPDTTTGRINHES